MSTPEKVSPRNLAAVAGGLIGAFMAVLNIQVVNTSLPDIQGGIGAGLDDGGWISTAYLIGEIIVIPLSGWLTSVFSLRRYLITNTVLFLFFSAACGLAGNFPEMVTLRALQGFSGGVLIPLGLLCVMTLLPNRVRPTGFAVFALSATFAPAIGPTIGGAITDIYGWRYIFFLNLVPGVLMLSALVWGLQPAPMQLEKFRQGDWVGVITMAVGLGTLQTVLEEGNKDDWFGSVFIQRLSVISAISLIAFLVQELRPGNKTPLVNLRLLALRNFAFSSITNTTLGFVLYSAVYLIPLYLAVAHGYSAEQAGLVMAWIGLPQLLIIPFSPYLMRRIDPRLLLLAGLMLFTISSFMNMNLGPDDSGPQMLLPNLIRAVGQALVFPSMTFIATAGIPMKDAGSASVLFNMLRNLGGAIGIAVVQTFITNREKFHSAIITPNVSLLNAATQQRLQMLRNYFMAHGMNDPAAAQQQAIHLLGVTVRLQADYFAYGDAFALLGAVMLVSIAATMCLKKVVGAGASGGH
ncbi:MDR family MFS transporter [Acidocella aromatica]|uniref:DHA2 family multidrug resistance protein n=1 Tax=Acidocella aromatica TaxID=1303579 RepID=A0A840VFZ3_9PROT|nr:DHA2 family multidrug resistance protein [Acidocella aromatica]